MSTLAERRRRTRGFYPYLSASVLLSLVFLIPLVWVVFRSLQPATLATDSPRSADFTHLTTANYRAVISQEHILVRVLNGAKEHGWGLMIMRERAAAIGARLSIESAPGHGTRIIVTLNGDTHDQSSAGG